MEIQKDHKDLAKSFAFGILAVLLTLLAVEALSFLAPSLYGDVRHTVEQWGVPGVFVGVFLGSTALPFPTDLLFVTAVNLANGSQMKMTMVAVAVVAGFLASLLNYWLASVLRDKFVQYFVSGDQLQSAKVWFDKYGPFPILFFGVIPSSPIFDPITFIAGLTGMDVKQFALYSLVSRFLHFGLLALLAAQVAI
ncbi:MAG: VTT domain-containing protein [Candidatus Micrarchaeota archaeon]|nr:VTT domain-containing protein [Candidatus Micrarchaeota archaeon]